MGRISGSRWRDDRGETLIEFGLAALVYFTMIFGTIELGIAVWRYNIISDLAQEGARWASVRGGSAGAIQAASAADVDAFVQSRAVGIPVTVTVPQAPSSLMPSDIVTVTVQSTFTPVTPLVLFGSPNIQGVGTINLQSTAQMVMSR
jgi:Flp pilus assembly protein TadG